MNTDYLFIVIIIQLMIILAGLFAIYRSVPTWAIPLLRSGAALARDYAAKTPGKADDQAVDVLENVLDAVEAGEGRAG